jgi:hypothetical protein
VSSAGHLGDLLHPRAPREEVRKDLPPAGSEGGGEVVGGGLDRLGDSDDEAAVAFEDAARAEQRCSRAP